MCPSSMWVLYPKLAFEYESSCSHTTQKISNFALALQISISPIFHSVGDQAISVADAGLSINAKTGEASGPWVAPKPSPSG